MKILVVYYSRTGTTKRVAEIISKMLKCDIGEIYDTKNREGIMGYLKSGRDASLGRLTLIKDIKYDTKQYDLIIIGTPVWAWNMATPVRTYIVQNKRFFKKTAFFCTMGGSSGKTFVKMETLSGKTALALLELKTREVLKNDYKDKVREFIKKLIK